MELLVVFDITTSNPAGARRLARVAKVCDAFGLRVQFSVFECRISDEDYEVFVDRLQSEINPQCDRVTLYRIPGKISLTRRMIGRGASTVDGPWIL